MSSLDVHEKIREIRAFAQELLGHNKKDHSIPYGTHQLTTGVQLEVFKKGNVREATLRSGLNIWATWHVAAGGVLQSDVKNAEAISRYASTIANQCAKEIRARKLVMVD